MSNLPIPAGKGAVFLSYASQDVAAASSICAALRDAGIEVWFDQTDLQGGHAWDAKIRRQIAECALFVPIISAATQARVEGYFRIEWKLAAQRTHAMADERVFLWPVVIDDTTDAEAMVPAEFRAVQWTRLRAGQATPAFIGRVQKLLAVEGIERTASRAAAARSKRMRFWPWTVAAAALILAAGAALEFGPWPRSASTTPTADDPTTDPKAVAVLPFVNLSGDPSQDYLSEGLTDEIISVLAREPDLRVPGRSSSFAFKGRTVDPAEIARTLRVSRLVEGSVQRVGNRLRIRVTLANVAQGFSEALESFDADVQTNVFELQGKIARAILEKLTKRKITKADPVLTTNPKAWDLYLQGRAHQVQGTHGTKKSIEYFLQAVEFDPKFAMAWARLAAARALRLTSVTIEDRKELPEARAAAARALALQPDLTEALIVQAFLARAVDYDFATAERILNQVASLRPATPELRLEQGLLARDRGKWAEARRMMGESLALEPHDGNAAQQIGMVAAIRGDYAEGESWWKRAAVLQGTASGTPFMTIVSWRHMWRGADAALRLVERHPPDQPLREMERARLLFWLGRAGEATALVAQHLTELPADTYQRRTYLGLWLAAGRKSAAERLAEQLRTEAQAQMDRGNRAVVVRSELVTAMLAVGQREAAVAQLHAWRDDTRELAGKSTWQWLYQYAFRVAPLLGQAGRNDEAIGLLTDIVDHGFQLGYSLRGNPDYASCHADPRYQALVRKAEAWAAALPDPADL